jgi:hypothetical protein
MELGESGQPPSCFRSKCPGRMAREFSQAFARAMQHVPLPETEEENTIAEMRAQLWAAGIGAGDAEFAARQLYQQGCRIIKVS